MGISSGISLVCLVQAACPTRRDKGAPVGTMFIRAIQHFLGLADSDFEQLELEDVAVAACAYESFEGQSDEQSKIAGVPELVERWLRIQSDSGPRRPPLRTQLLLRSVLDRLTMHGVSDMHRNELDLLAHVHSLISKIPDPERFSRLRAVYEQNINALEMAREAMPRAPGMAGLESLIQYVFSDDLQNAPARNVKIFAGVELPGHGPVFSCSGSVKVLDSVPDDCMLVVENGSCAVNGYVLGRVAASLHCEVSENIAGVVITERGDVRARNILDNATVISKWGAVYASKAENPKLVFAGESIQLDDHARLGTFAAKRIEVSGTVTSGEYSVSELLSAERFAQTDTRDLIIQLRTSISCELFGGLIDPEASNLVSHLTRLERDAEDHRRMRSAAKLECDQLADNGITFLLAADAHRSELEQITRTQRRIAFLDRVISGLDTLCIAAGEAIARENQPLPSNVQAESVPESKSLSLVESEMEHIQSEGEEVPDFKQKQQELHQAKAALAKTGRDLPHVIVRLKEKQSKWLFERRQLQDAAIAAANSLGNNDSRAALLGQGRTTDKVQLFERLLAMARARPIGDELLERAQAPFVQIMLRSIQNRREHMKSYALQASAIDDEIRVATDLLHARFGMAPPDRREAENSQPTVRGIFEPGVIMCTERYYVNEARAPQESVVRIRTSNPSAQTFIRQGDKIFAEESPRLTTAR